MEILALPLRIDLHYSVLIINKEISSENHDVWREIIEESLVNRVNNE